VGLALQLELVAAIVNLYLQPGFYLAQMAVMRSAEFGQATGVVGLERYGL
jgi:hypothetical protein